MTTDTWASRVAEDFDDPFGPQINERGTTPTKKRRFSQAELTKLCEESGLDPLDKKARARASYAHKQTKKKDWIKAASTWGNELIGDADSLSGESTFQSASSDSVTTLSSETSSDGETIDEAINLEKFLTGSSDAAMTDTVEEAIFDQLVNSQPDAASQYTQLGFLKKFSANNHSPAQRDKFKAFLLVLPAMVATL